jgi:uncharacterized protein (TIRG00374 family)
MASKKHSAMKKRYLLVVAGLALFLLYLYFFVPFNELVEAVQRINPFYFFLAFCALLASVALYALAWKRLLSLLSVKTSFLKAFQFVWVENFVDLVVPGEPVSGELSKIYLMSKEPGANYGNVVASAVGQRIAAMSVSAIGLLASVLYFASIYRPPLLILGFAGAVLLGDIIVIILLFYLATRKEATQRLTNWLFTVLTKVSRGHWKLEQLKERVTKSLDVFHEGISILNLHRKSLVLPVVLTALSWLSDLSIAILVFLSLGFIGTAIPISAIIIVYLITGAIQYLPIGVIPGEVGLAEIIMTTLFALLGSSQFISIFAVATVLIRSLTFWVRLLVSGLVVQLVGMENLMPAQPPQPQTPATSLKQDETKDARSFSFFLLHF